MTKRYKIVQKKLEELEAELHQVFTLPSETPCHHLLSEGIEQRFVFLNNLLSAEIASHPKKPHHLLHIAQRLAELEIAFHEWDDFKTSSSLALLDHIETASKCSCTESCLNDDDGGDDVCAELGSQVFEDPEVIFFDEVMDEKVAEKEVEERESVDERREKGQRGWVGGCFCGSMASGVMVGMALMGFLMVSFSGCFHYMRHDFVLTPT